MIDSSADLKLGSEFAAVTRDDWRKLVDVVLKGRPFEKLVAKTYDGLRIEPLYPGTTDARPLTGRAAGPWQIMQRVDHPDPPAANAQALQDLEGGATGLSLVFASAVGSYDYGVAEEALARVLDGVRLDAGIALECDLSPLAKNVAVDIGALLTRGGVAPGAAEVRFGFDPLGASAHRTMGLTPWTETAPQFATLIADLARQGFKGPFAAADARPIHAAGGSEVQELAFALAVALAYLRALQAGGIALELARRMIFFRLAADADQFLTIAKFRALRKLWARVEEACGLAPAPAFVTAETAWRMMTKRDPHVNMLRTTMAAFSAALGGADAITVLPFTAALGLPDAFARRIARNTQLLLLEEAHLAKVADAGAGSGAIEDLTLQLCRAAWGLFQEIERAGGAAGALESCLIQNKVAAVRAEREHAIAHRIDVLTGTTEFPNIAEAPVSVLDVAPVSSTPSPTAAKLASMPRMRLAEPFERLRDASDRLLADTGSRPKVFLANLGRPSDFSARASFAKNFFEAGGIETVTSDGFASRAALLDALRASRARLMCLCSSDEVYATEAADVARAASAVPGIHVCLAGRPRDSEAALKAAGVETFIYAGCDALATLGGLYHHLTQ